MNIKDRTKELTASALQLAERVGWSNLTRDAIATEAGVSGALVTFRLGTMTEAKRKVMRAAVAARSLRVVAEGLAVGDRHARKAPDDLKAEAAAWIATQ